MMKTKRLRRPSPTVTRIGAAEPIVDESEPVEKEESQKIKDQAAAMQRIANLLNGKKPETYNVGPPTMDSGPIMPYCYEDGGLC